MEWNGMVNFIACGIGRVYTFKLWFICTQPRLSEQIAVHNNSYGNHVLMRVWCMFFEKVLKKKWTLSSSLYSNCRAQNNVFAEVIWKILIKFMHEKLNRFYPYSNLNHTVKHSHTRNTCIMHIYAMILPFWLTQICWFVKWFWFLNQSSFVECVTQKPNGKYHFRCWLLFAVPSVAILRFTLKLFAFASFIHPNICRKSREPRNSFQFNIYLIHCHL